ncbi:MAG: S9 family peptidase [Erysipelotrichaceae bacterium]|jgi:dipeptidyl aminopeptidase/acylaminoacyl peptidase|nr:S9 family peptidase [Erysipelotrichaceae bacterium]
MKKLTSDALASVTSLSNLKANSAKTAAGFVSGKADIKSDGYVNALYVTDGYTAKKLLNLKEFALWCWEDDDRILYQAQKTPAEKKEGKEMKTVLYTIDIHSKVSEKAFTLPIPVGKITKFKKNLYILETKMNDLSWRLLKEKDRKAVLKDDKTAMWEEWKELPFYINAQGYQNGKKNQVLLYDAKKDKITPLTSPDFNVVSCDVDVKNGKVIFAGEHLGLVKNKYDTIYLYDGSETKKLVSCDIDISNVSFFRDTIYVWANDFVPFGRTQISSLYEIQDGNLVKLATPTFDPAFYYGKSEFGNANYTLLGSYGYRSSAYFYNGTDFEILFPFAGTIQIVVIVKGIYIALAAPENHPYELYAINAEGGIQKQLTTVNEDLLKVYSHSDASHFSFSSDNVEIDGWVILPVNYKPGKKYPGILEIHGGPRGAYSPGYDFGFQLLANDGYFVFFCNPRGSSGKGNEFAELRGIFGTIDYDDIMRFVDEVLKRYPDIDETRLGVTGISYGGYMTNWLIGHTDRFAAAISENSVSNWASMYSTSDIGYDVTYDYVVGSPFENLENIWKQSPAKYVDQAVTPTLFIHSDADYRCPMEQAFQMYVPLKVKGVDSEFVLYKNEHHGVSIFGKPAKRLHRYNKVLDWFKKYLKKDN